MDLESPLRNQDSMRLGVRAQHEGVGTFHGRCPCCDHLYRAQLTRDQSKELRLRAGKGTRA